LPPGAARLYKRFIKRELRMDPIVSTTDYAVARNHMVDSQVRPNKVIDQRVLDAMRALPREEFVPPSLSAIAYIDEDLPLGGGRVLVEPMVIARLVQLARVRPGERVLVIAAGTGYGAALMAACGAEVTALDDDEALLAIALRVLPRHAPAVKIVHGALPAGLPQGAPWDIILLEGAVTEIPSALAAQVAPNGRLVTVVVSQGVGGRAVLAEPAGTPDAPRLRSREAFDCSTPLLPGLRPAPVFVF
jgi:protein-L-isoaspartate(D-aspartate) O-methyltransferase